MTVHSEAALAIPQLSRLTSATGSKIPDGGHSGPNTDTGTMIKPKTFHLDTASLELPGGAHTGGTRHILSFGGQPVAAFTQGKFRPYIHPVWKPGGLL